MFNLNAQGILTFINNISSGIIIVSSDFIIEFCNYAAGKILGFKSEDYLKKNISDFFSEETALTVIKKTLSDNNSFSRIVTKYKNSDGNFFFIGFTTSPYLSPAGNVAGVIMNFRDITEEISLQNRVKFSEQKYKLLIQNLQSPVVLLGYSDLSVKEFNKSAFTKIKGLNTHSFKTFIDFIFIESRDTALNYFEKIKNNIAVQPQVEIITFDINDNIRILELTAGIIEINEEKFIQTVCFDITEKKELSINLLNSFNELKETQEILIRAERLAAAGELSAGISHEIKNRFQVIANAMAYIKSKIDMNNEALRVNINYVENEVSRGVKLINDLMEFAKPHEPLKKKISINELLQNSIPLLSKQFEKKNISCIEEYSEINDILADYNLLQQVIINILKNAEQAMSAGGELNIKTYISLSSNIRIINYGAARKHQYNEYIVIEIADTGVGIDKENISKIFSPFYTSKGPNEGTGLGLSVSYTIIEKHEGFFDVKSSPGSGTVFFIYLPYINIV